MNPSKPRNRGPSVILRTLLLLALTGSLVSPTACERALMVAPSNALMSLSAESFTLANNSSTTITAILTDSAGSAVADGTLVLFRSTLGSMDPTTSNTSNGRAFAKLVAGNLSGTASITASSGSVQAAALQVQIGMVPARILLSSTPSSTNASDVTATVYDSSGAPIMGASVAFTAASGTLSSPVALTDANGQARTTLFSPVDALVTAQAGGLTANVTARVGGSTTLAVNVRIDPSAPARLQSISFTATVQTIGGAAALVERYEWDFGDLVMTTTGNTTSRFWETSGRYGVTLRVFGAGGATGQTHLEFYVN